MDRSAVVTCFLRNRGEILLFRRAHDAGTYPDRWGAVSGYVETDDPRETASMEIAEETGITDPSLVRTGAPFSIRDEASDRVWTVHPFLFDVDTRDLRLNEETAEAVWVPATELLRRATVPALWTSYRHVAPAVETVRTDTDRGSAAISITALEVLRDAAGEASVRERGLAPVAETARALLDARPSMAVLTNRINRAMAGTHAPAAVERAAIEGIERAFEVDQAAAEEAASALGTTVLTLSRSGTVERALRQAEPSVYVAESRPAGEGVGVAERLADAGLEVTLCTDAAIATLLADGEIDSVLVGADTIRFDGAVVNKTGTRSAALAAANEDVPFLVACAVDKISHDPTIHLEAGDPKELYAGSAALEVVNPRFDLTPASLVDGYLTDRGRLAPTDIDDIATELASLADWQEQE